VVLNVTPDHLDRHGTFEKYAAAKGRLLETQTADDWAILNADDRTCLAYAGATRSRVMWFSSTRGVTPGLWLQDGWLWMDGEKLMEGADVPLRGQHNLENAMAAAGAAYLAGADREEIARAIRTFPGVEHRLEYVRTVRGADYYNDSKATNVDASLKAIAAFAGGLWIILGGKDKDSDYTPLRAPLFARSRGALLVGAAAEKIERQLGGVVPVYRCGDMQTAVTQAHRLARTGDTVLLAPACASFDQFDNYEHRGRVFKSLVAELSEA
jgi:UDP-N-acetylmuramoylalanine--D-glutamate ligase